MLINAVIYFLLYLLALNLWKSFKEKGVVSRLVKGLRFRHFGWACLTLFSAVFTLGLLISLGPEWFQWGWFKLLTGANGTAVSAAASPEVKHTVPTFLIVGIYALLLLTMPYMVYGEERLFRHGAEGRSWIVNVGMAILFGLTHMIVGFPIFAALALAAPGLILTFVYQRAYRRHGDAVEATLESSRAHLANNLLAFGLAGGLVLLIRLVGPQAG